MVNRRELKATSRAAGRRALEDYGPQWRPGGRSDEIGWPWASRPAGPSSGCGLAGAQALLVHHGLSGETTGRITGWMKPAHRDLIPADFIVVDLPPPGCPQKFGNNAALAAELGWTAQARFGEQQPALISGTVTKAQSPTRGRSRREP